MHRTHGLAGLTLAIALLGSVPQAQSSEDLYNRAYVLENEEGDYAAAASAYERILDSSHSSSEMRAKVEGRLAICREEIACEDFADLMPENPLLYVELNRPGDQLEALLEELGLLQMARAAAGDEGAAFGVSPALVQGLLGVRGGAVAITGVNPSSGQPTGVAVLNPGDLDLVRGLIETALPNGAESAGQVEGFPTYKLHDGSSGAGYVTLTARLVVASTHKREIKNVIERLNGSEDKSLSDNARLRDAMGDRRSALLTFCANPGPLVPLAKMAGSQDPQAAAIMQVCDPASFETVVGQLRVNDGLGLELALNMAKGHQNLVYDFMRMPPIQRATLDRIPVGVAAFMAGSLNPARTYTTDHGGDAYVSFMDIGRELFGNIASYAVFTLPPDGTSESHGWPMPRAGAVLTVNDPAKTKNLWWTMLGVASLGAGGDFAGETVEIAGGTAQRFTMPEGIAVYAAVDGSEFYLGTSRDVIEAALATRNGGPSIRRDKELSAAVARLSPDSTVATVVHVGRCLEIAGQYEHDDELQMIAPHVSKTAASLVFSHGSGALRFSLGVSELPNVGDLFAAHMQAGGGYGHGGDHGYDGDDAGGSDSVVGLDEAVAEFDRLAKSGHRDEALARFEGIYPQVSEDARWLNNFAWALLTEGHYHGKYADLAAKLSKRSNDLTSFDQWAYVDTLALALFESGDVEKAIELEKRAIELVGDEPGTRADLEASLARFQSAARTVSAGDA